ncbi:MAG TPA: TetR/AcrR family transcriptional regulator [Acidimicrobiales bacterium]|nr:TetR/AcrR family transcriptional regulator [Acidimicrobiales bacterium]
MSDGAIFDAVTAVVAEVGPSGLTLSAVADKVGLSAPALAQRFGSKRNLLVAYAAASAQGLEGLFDDARRRSPDALSAVIAALVAFSASVATRRAMANNLAFLHLDLTDAELGAHAARQSRALRRRIADLLREAQASGDLGPVDPAALADTLYTTYNGALVTWAIDGRGTLARWLRERLDRVLGPHLPKGE